MIKWRTNTVKQSKLSLSLQPLLLLAVLYYPIISLPPAQAAPSCAKNYKAALSQAYQRYSEPLKYAVSVSHKKVDVFDGKWMVSPAIALGDKTKRLSKKKRRRSKAGLVLIPLKNSHFSALSYTAQEKQILTIADSIVRWRGKDPAFNKRGRYGWLTSRIAADLRVYMGQPDHPALCTGANLMMDHLYNNSGRFRKRVAFIKKLAPLAHQYAAARYRAFKYTMRTQVNPDFVKLGSIEKNISLSLLMTKVAKTFQQRRFTAQVDQEPQFLATLALLRTKTALAANPFKTKHSLTLTSLVLPQRRPSTTIKPSTIFKTKKQNKNIKTVAINNPTSANYSASFSPIPRKSSPISLRLRQLSVLQQDALRKSLSAIEAAYYIDHIAHSYEALNSSIYGAISSVRSAHKKHCHCTS